MMWNFAISKSEIYQMNIKTRKKGTAENLVVPGINNATENLAVAIFIGDLCLYLAL